MKTVEVSIGKIVFDDRLYPRGGVDDATISRYRMAMAEGAIFPPPILEAKTFRSVDGRHRIEATRRLLGDDAKIAVELRTYKSESELMLDALRLNTKHGVGLAPFDIATAITRLHVLGVDDALIRKELAMSEGAYESLVQRKIATYRKGEIPVKRTLSHLAGTELTKPAMECNRRAGGMQQMFYVNQVIDLVEHNLIDRENSPLMAKLVRLAELIQERIAAVA